MKSEELGCGSEVKHLPSMHKVQDSVPSSEKKKEKRKIEDNNTHIFGTTSVLLHCWLAGLV
jgi:hypothetical protein